jgi:hypothetical protein
MEAVGNVPTKQWKVKSKGYTKTHSKERAARIDYNRVSKTIQEEEEGRVELFSRQNKQNSWELDEEFELGEDE